MKYFKNTELAKLYNISEKSVRNWIQAAVDGRLELGLYKKEGKHFVANTAKNTLQIEQLVLKGKKYKNSRGFKIISPTPKFYDTYTTKQIFDIISNLTVHRELPLKYSYVDGGAEYWDRYAQRLADETAPNMLTSTVNLLSSNIERIDSLLGNHKSVNVVDLGPGNVLPVKEILGYLLDQGKLNKYIALDISKEMLDIAERNVRLWFDNKINFEGHIRDIDHERFDDLIGQDFSQDGADSPINLILLLGGTLCNLRSPNQALQAINNSMGLGDLFVYSTKLDTPNSRRYFDFNITPEGQELTPRHRLALDMLNIDKSLYETEQLFDDRKQARFIKIRFKVALSIKFELPQGIRWAEFHKGDAVLLWRYWHQDALEIINQSDQNDLNLLQAAKSNDQEHLLLISKIKRDA